MHASSLTAAASCDSSCRRSAAQETIVGVAAAEVARSTSSRGEIALRRRSDEALELRVNGLFVMDTVETTAERLFARTVLGKVGGAVRVLVGGIGLGFTLTEVLAAHPAVGPVLVAEIEPALLGWHRAGLVPQTASWLADRRVCVAAADVADVVTGAPAASPGGVLAFWSADASTELAAQLTDTFDSVEEVTVPVTLGRRETTYSLLLGRTQRAGERQLSGCEAGDTVKM